MKQQNPSSESNSSSTTKKFPCLTKTQGSLPCSQEPPLVPIFSQRNPVHSLPSCFFTTNFNINLPPIHKSSRGIFLSGFLPKHCMHFFSSPYVQYVLLPSHFYPIHHPNNVWWGAKIMKLLSLLQSFTDHYYIITFSKVHNITARKQDINYIN